jgi:hypothetical protein
MSGNFEKRTFRKSCSMAPTRWFRLDSPPVNPVSRFENRLLEVFTHLNQIYRSIAARLKAEQMRRHVMAVLTVWEKWIVFNADFIQVLSATFQDKGPAANRSQDVIDNDVDGQPMEDIDGVPLST